MNTNFKDIRAVRSHRSLDAAVRDNEALTAMPLDALRDAKQFTQVQLAQLLQISQGAVSKAERRTDMFISTLRSYVRAIGGDLEIRAVFPEGDVLIDQFKEIDDAERNRARMAGSHRLDSRQPPDSN